MIKSISLVDWIYLAAGLAGLVIGWLGRTDRLPAAARTWLRNIGEPALRDLVTEAAEIQNMQPSVRRAYVLNELRSLAERELGVSIPTSIANLLLEYVYQKTEKTQKVKP